MEDKKLKKPIIKFSQWEWLTIISLIFFALFGPLLFSKLSLFNISFLNTGQIGDTIGGISAPFVSLLAAFLVYKSFVAQIQANQDQRNDHEDQMKLIRQEQTLNTVIHLIEKVENDIYAKENTIEGGSVNSLRELLKEFYQDKEFPYSGEPNKATANLNFNFQRVLSLIESNIGNLQRVFNLINHYSSTYDSEENVYDLSNFYASKLSEILVKTQYLNLINEKYFNRMFAEKALSEENQNALTICQLAAAKLSARLESFMYDVRVKRVLEGKSDNTGELA